MEELPNLNVAVGLALKAYREQFGVIQLDLAGRVDGSLSAIKKLEHDDRTPSLKTVLLLCNALAVDPCDFIYEVLRHHAFLEDRNRRAAVWNINPKVDNAFFAGVIPCLACDLDGAAPFVGCRNVARAWAFQPPVLPSLRFFPPPDLLTVPR